MLHYNIHKKEAATLVLLHGFMENSEMWYKMLPKLCEKYQILKIDLPGHGNSELSTDEMSIDKMAEEVNEVCNHLQINNFYLIGHSMGGYVSLAYTEKYPEKVNALGLFFSTFLADTEEKKEIREKSKRIITENFPIFTHAGVPNLFSETERYKLIKEIDFAEKMALKTPILGVLASVNAMIKRPDRLNVIHNFQNKILIILGRKDTAIDANLLQKSIPNKNNIHLYILDCGHMGHLEKPNICTEIIFDEFK